jgi:hypothetical protein
MPSPEPAIARPWPLKIEAAVFLACVVIAFVPAAMLLAQHDGNVSALLNIGAVSASRPSVAPDFHDPVLEPGYGHDGQQFYAVSRAFPHLQQVDGKVDRARYRTRRILFPMLVAPFPDGAPTVWAMLAVNLLAVGFAGVAAARLARGIGGPAWLGLAAALSPALLVSVRASLGDGVAFALAIWGVVLWRRHLGWAVLLFALAALARETALVAPAACLLCGDRRQRLALTIPFITYGAWVLWVSATVHPHLSPDSSSPFGDALRQFDAPLRAWDQLGWTSRPTLLGAALVLASALAAYALRDLLPEIAVWLVAEIVLVVIAAGAVAEDTLNYARLAPLATIGVALAAWAVHASPARRGDRKVPTPS